MEVVILHTPLIPSHTHYSCNEFKIHEKYKQQFHLLQHEKYSNFLVNKNMLHLIKGLQKENNKIVYRIKKNITM